MTTWEMESGGWWSPKWKASDDGSRGKLVIQKKEKRKKKKFSGRMDWGNILHRISLNKKGERWQHFTCWRMKVFIVAKMRATLQKQHRDTTVTQPGAQLQPLPIRHCAGGFLQMSSVHWPSSWTTKLTLVALFSSSVSSESVYLTKYQESSLTF